MKKRPRQRAAVLRGGKAFLETRRHHMRM